VDVGGIYDHPSKRYDHHQKSYTEKYVQTASCCMSSVGLIFKHYGQEFIAKIVDSKMLKSQSDFKKFQDKIYFNVIAELDAVDNNLQQYESPGKIKYFINTSLPSVISKLNCEKNYSKEQEIAFHQAVSYATMIFEILVKFYFRKFIKFEEEYIKSSNLMETRFSVSPEILIFKEKYENWASCLLKYEEKHPYKEGEKKLQYIIYPSADKWYVKAISSRGKIRNQIKPENIIKPKLLHPDQLVFIHKDLFVAEATTIETAIEIAKISI
jgi:uncharacterized UPF0160 family protein